jgi:DNA-directed RNA polymerase sigma subunit (sigma70/sigma32)
MTSATPPDDRHEALFIADFCPRLGAYLARQHANGYDAVAGRTRYLLWLAAHTDDGALMASVARAARLPRLTAEEETDLATRLRAGRSAEERLAECGGTLAGQARADLERAAEDGARASDRLLEANLALVASISKRFTGRGMPYPDLIREGRLGLTRAIERYDPTKGYRFTTYATWWIRQAITRAIADQSRAIRIPVHKNESMNKFLRATRELEKELGRTPTNEEIGRRMDIPVEKVQKLKTISRDPVPLETPVGRDGESAPGDPIEDRWVGSPVDAVIESNVRVILTHDLSTIMSAVRQQLQSAGICAPIVLVPDSLPIGSAIEEILLLDEFSTKADWASGVVCLPLG